MEGLALAPQWQWLMLAIPVVVVLVCAIQLAWYAWRRRGSDAVSATVVAHRAIDESDESDESDEGPREVAVLEFDAQGKPWRIEDRMAVRPGTYRVGQSVHLYVPRDDPSSAYISRPWQARLVGVVFVVGLFFLWVAYRALIRV